MVGVGGILLKDGKILLIKRKNEPGKGLWSVPGGLVEPGETLEKAIRREIREETGLDVEVVRPIHVAEVVERDEDGRIRYHYVLVDFLCREAGGRIRPGDDAKEVRWIPLDRAGDLPLTRTTKELIEELTRSFFLVVRNRDISRVLMAVPKGHEHMRTIFELGDGSLIVFQEATMENVARAVVEVEMHPRRRALILVGKELENRKEGYDKYQLIEEDVPEENVINEVTRLLGLEEDGKA